MANEQQTIRFNGAQVRRAIYAGGGLWSVQGIAIAVGRDRKAVRAWVARKRTPFPAPICKVTRTNYWAGEDVLTWLEQVEKWEAAERFTVAMNECLVGMAVAAKRAANTPAVKRATVSDNGTHKRTSDKTGADDQKEHPTARGDGADSFRDSP